MKTPPGVPGFVVAMSMARRLLFFTARALFASGGFIAMFMALSSAVLADFYAQRRGDSKPEGRREARCLGA
jgi:hypothetical protein